MHKILMMMAVQQATRHVHCPTCRARTKVTDIALVDAGRSAAKEEGQSAALADEEQIAVSGSYSTKVCGPPTQGHNNIIQVMSDLDVMADRVYYNRGFSFPSLLSRAFPSNTNISHLMNSYRHQIKYIVVFSHAHSLQSFVSRKTTFLCVSFPIFL